MERRKTDPTQVRANRIPVYSQGMKVVSKTIGTPLNYNLQTENLSRTGLLISKGNYKDIPFAINTLLEMTIDPDCQVFENPVRCLGKVVRTLDTGAAPQNSREQFGVQIIQIEGRDASDWESNIDRLEAGHAPRLNAG